MRWLGVVAAAGVIVVAPAVSVMCAWEFCRHLAVGRGNEIALCALSVAHVRAVRMLWTEPHHGFVV